MQWQFKKKRRIVEKKAQMCYRGKKKYIYLGRVSLKLYFYTYTIFIWKNTHLSWPFYSILLVFILYYSFYSSLSSPSGLLPWGKAKSSHHLDDCSTCCCHLKPRGNLSHFVIFCYSGSIDHTGRRDGWRRAGQAEKRERNGMKMWEQGKFRKAGWMLWKESVWKE